MIPLLIFVAFGVWLARQYTQANRLKWQNRQATLKWVGRYLAADAKAAWRWRHNSPFYWGDDDE